MPLDSPAAGLFPVLEAVSPAAHETGLRVLQGYSLAPTDAGHVAVLLGMMAPALGDTVLDAGCGFGEVARLMRLQRPDLAFILLNRVDAQLQHAPTGSGFLPVLGDMHAIPLASGSVDGVMFSWALCHADHPAALAEAARVVKPGGFLFLYELIRTGGDNALFERHLHARAYPVAELLGMCEAAGFALELFLAPTADDAQMRALFAGDLALHDAIFSDLRPAVWKLVRKGTQAPAATPAPSLMEGPTP